MEMSDRDKHVFTRKGSSKTRECGPTKDEANISFIPDAQIVNRHTYFFLIFSTACRVQIDGNVDVIAHPTHPFFQHVRDHESCAEPAQS